MCLQCKIKGCKVKVKNKGVGWLFFLFFVCEFVCVVFAFIFGDEDVEGRRRTVHKWKAELVASVLVYGSLSVCEKKGVKKTRE